MEDISKYFKVGETYESLENEISNRNGITYEILKKGEKTCTVRANGDEYGFIYCNIPYSTFKIK